MKIKKEEYRKQLDDRYWEGVESGIRFALENPELAKRNLNNIQGIRNIVEKMTKAFEALSANVKNMFGGEEE